MTLGLCFLNPCPALLPNPAYPFLQQNGRKAAALTLSVGVFFAGNKRGDKDGDYLLLILIDEAEQGGHKWLDLISHQDGFSRSFYASSANYGQGRDINRRFNAFGLCVYYYFSLFVARFAKPESDSIASRLRAPGVFV